MVGSDICGYDGVTTDNLCSRWIFLGAFSPFFRDHSDNTSPPHELYRTAATAAAARAAIDIRYRLLDYAYTAFYRQTQTGTPMLSPMFFMYPTDSKTAKLPYQFFWGPSIMVAPVTDQDSTSVNVYFPRDQFYDFDTGAPVTGTGNTVTLTNIAFTKIPLYFKGGSIVPMRIKSALTTTALRTQNFVLTVAPNAQGFANGTLYLDDGESITQPSISDITFTYSNGKLVTSGTFGYDPGNVEITQVIVLGSHGLSKAMSSGNYDSANKKATFNVNQKLTGSWSIQLQ
jgi:alpha-glucosidase